MNGEFAQIIAIVTHGTAWLRDPASVDLDAFVAGNSTFQYVAQLVLDDAGTLPEWLRARADEGVERLWLAHVERVGGDGRLAPHLAAAFVGGGSAAILASGRTTSTVWRADWAVIDRGAPDRRIWGVTYHGREFDARPAQPDVDAAASRLVAALEAAREFATKKSLDNWASWFAEALSQWEVPEKTPRFHPDLFPPGLFDERAVRLASMAQSSHVFGGMGSWNDVGYSGATTDERTRRSRRSSTPR